MTLLNQLWNYISNWGLSHQYVNDTEELRIRVLNRVLFISIPAIVLFLLLSYFYLSFSLRYVIAGSLYTFSYIFALFSIAKGKHNIARHILVSSGLILVFYLKIFSSKYFIDQFFPLIPTIGFIYLFFERKMIVRYNLLTYFIIALATIKFLIDDDKNNVGFDHITAIVLFILCFSILLALLEFFKRTNYYYIEDLKEKQKLIDEAQALANVGSWSYFFNDQQLDVSQQLFKILNRKITGNSIEIEDLKDILPKEEREKFAKALSEDNKNFYIDLDYEYPTLGETKWLRYIVEYYQSNPSDKGKLLGIIQDITERKQIEQQVKQLLAEVQRKNSQLQNKSSQLHQSNFDLKRSNQELEQFAYVASHDLQEPLRMVGNFVQLLEEEYGNVIDEEGKSYITFAVDGVTRMNRLIEDLLQYSRVGRKKAQMHYTDIEGIVKTKLLDLQKRIVDKNATVSMTNLPNVLFCETTQIGIVFYNLILNALKFNKKANPTVEINAEEQETDWLFSVKDNGIGIDQRNQDKVFEIFKRLHRKEEFEGTGIGLALCKRIILGHHGDIWFESEKDKGTTFFFTIPKDLRKYSQNE